MEGIVAYDVDPEGSIGLCIILKVVGNDLGPSCLLICYQGIPEDLDLSLRCSCISTADILNRLGLSLNLSSGRISVSFRDHSPAELIPCLHLCLNEGVECESKPASKDSHRDLTQPLRLHGLDQTVAVVGLQLVYSIRISDVYSVGIDLSTVLIRGLPADLHKDVVHSQRWSLWDVRLGSCSDRRDDRIRTPAVNIEGFQSKHVGLTCIKTTDLGVSQCSAEEALFSNKIIPCGSIGTGVPLKVVGVNLYSTSIISSEGVPEEFNLALSCRCTSCRSIHLIGDDLDTSAIYIGD